MHLAALDELTNDLLPALARLAESLSAKAREFDDVVKSGRTHWMDAVPVTLGQEFGGYAAQVRQGIARVESTLERVGEIPLGGTAVGTGLNTHPEFAARVREKLSAATGLRILPPADPFEATAARDALVEASGALKVVAVSLTKIANDLRFMGSGPRAGLAEIFLPELQKGSSIMPGKVNPVIPEVVTQVAAQVIGNDTAITVGGMQGHFELNVFVPLIARNLLDSIKLLGRRVAPACRKMRGRDRGESRDPGAVRRADALRRHGAQPVHRLRQGGRDREGGRRVRPPAARGRARGGCRRGNPRAGARLPHNGASARLVAAIRFHVAVRCAWVPEGDPALRRVPRRGMGLPSHDERHLFELLVLEGAQAGLSWSTILHKREGYRRAFAEFDVDRVARFGPRDVQRLLGDASIVRNRLKIESAIANAQATIEAGGLDELLWSFVGGKPLVNRWGTLAELPAETDESRAMSKELKRRGFRFVGPTTCYSLMQACGLVNDHTVDCFRYSEV